MKKNYFLPTFSVILIIIFYSYLPAGINTWTYDLGNVSISNNCLLIHPTVQQIMYAGASTGVYLTIDAGTTWVMLSGSPAVTSLAIANSNPNILYAGTASSGIFKSTNAGNSWFTVNTGLTEYSMHTVQAIVIKPNDPNTVVTCLFNGTTDAAIGVYKTTNGGALWSAAANGLLTTMHNFLCLICNPFSPNTIYMGSSFYVSQIGPCYIYKSYDFGSTWVNSSNGLGTSSASTDVIRALSYGFIDTNHVLAGLFFNTTNGGPWMTTNAGQNWQQIAGGIPVITTPGPMIRSVKIGYGNNNLLFFGGDFSSNFQPGGVWRSTNGGANWWDFNCSYLSDTNSVSALNLRVSDYTIFAGVSWGNTGIYEYTVLPYPVGISENKNNVQRDYFLSQNYPNPFNPVTFINYRIPHYSFVKLSVFDVIGKEVKILVDEFQNAGSHNVKFDGVDFVSGIYFYSLFADGVLIDTKKMVLIK